MNVTIVQPSQLGPEEAKLWTKFQQTSPVMSNPFLSFTFAQVVGRHRPGARVAVIEEAGCIVGFLPFELISRKFAVPIGHSLNELQGFIGSGAGIDARAVVRKVGLRGWRFVHAPAEQDWLVPHHYEDARVQCQIVDLTDGYRSYYESRRRQSVKRMREKQRSLARNIGIVSLQWHSGCMADVHRLIDWKGGRYWGARQLFADRSVFNIVEELAVSVNADCRGIVTVMRAGERPVAAHVGLIGPWGLTWWFPSYDDSLSRFSPGTIMLFSIAEEAANRGIVRIDLGGGQDSYKFSVANGSYLVAGGAVWASRVEETARRVYRTLRKTRNRSHSA